MACPICGDVYPESELATHANAHFEEPGSEGPGAANQTSFVDLTSTSFVDLTSSSPEHDESVTCPICGDQVPLDEIASHELMHKLDEAPGDDERKVLMLQEKEDFYQLRKRYGLDGGSPKRRKGTCYNCHEEGHWSSDCPRKPQLPVPKPLSLRPAELREAQAREPSTPDGEPQLIRVIKRLLEGQRVYSCRAALSCAVHFYGGGKQDLGWGCGWRNLQILASGLLRRDGVGSSLFGGAGFVPDIHSLQAWMEVAWADGFDPEGAEHFGGRVQGTKKWIGATDAATLLRYFGVHALLVDFRRAPVPSDDAGKCSKCDAALEGTRLRSITDRSVQVCEACAPMVPPGSNFLAMEPSRSLPGTPPHTVLAEWVWRYFSSDDPPPEASSSKALSEGSTVEGGSGGGAGEGGGGRGGSSKGGARPLLGRGGLGAPVSVSNRPPLFFQHDGHSRTIVGIERRKLRAGSPEEWFLLVLDPGMTTKEVGGALGAGTGWQKVLKRGVHTLRMDDYQLLMVAPGLAEGEERTALKAIEAFEVCGGA